MVLFERDPGTRITTAIARGPLSIADMREAAAKAWAGATEPSVRILWGLREAQFQLSATEVRQLAEFGRQQSPIAELRMAFLVSGDLEFGLVRMFGAHRENGKTQIGVFRDKDEAVGWLDEQSA